MIKCSCFPKKCFLLKKDFQLTCCLSSSSLRLLSSSCASRILLTCNQMSSEVKSRFCSPSPPSLFFFFSLYEVKKCDFAHPLLPLFFSLSLSPLFPLFIFIFMKSRNLIFLTLSSLSFFSFSYSFFFPLFIFMKSINMI